VSKDTKDKLGLLPSRKCKKKLSLFERYKKLIGKFADSIKAGSKITIQSQGKLVSKSDAFHLKLVKKQLSCASITALVRKRQEVKQSLCV